MAEDLAKIVPDQDAREADGEATEHFDGDTPPPYQSRFQLLFGVLLGVGLAAIVATVLVVAGGRRVSDPGAAVWAPWRPTASDGLQAVNQIAEHVGQRYTLPSGD